MASFPTLPFAAPPDTSSISPNVRAISGMSIATLARSAAYRTYPLGNSAPRTVLVLCAGTWDLVNEGASGATTYSRLASYAQGATAAGFDYVIGTTITPAYVFDGTTEPERLDANTRILADASGAFTGGVANLAADPSLDDYTDTTYYLAPGLHFTGAGAGAAAAVLVPKLSAVLV